MSDTPYPTLSTSITAAGQDEGNLLLVMGVGAWMGGGLEGGPRAKSKPSLLVLNRERTSPEVPACSVVS